MNAYALIQGQQIPARTQVIEDLIRANLHSLIVEKSNADRTGRKVHLSFKHPDWSYEVGYADLTELGEQTEVLLVKDVPLDWYENELLIKCNEWMEDLSKAILKLKRKGGREVTAAKERKVIKTLKGMEKERQREFREALRSEDVKRYKVTGKDVFERIGGEVGLGKRAIEKIIQEYRKKNE